MKKIYVVIDVVKEMKVGGVPTHIDTIKGVDGIIGVMVVFANKRKAQKWAGKREVLTFEPIPKEVKP